MCVHAPVQSHVSPGMDLRIASAIVETYLLRSPSAALLEQHFAHSILKFIC